LESNLGSFLRAIVGETATSLGAMVLEGNALAWQGVDGDLGSFGNFHVLGRRVIGRTVAGFGKNASQMNGMDTDKEVPIRKNRARTVWAGKRIEEWEIFDRGILEIRGRGSEDKTSEGAGLIGSNAADPLAFPDNTNDSTFMGAMCHGFGESAFPRYGRFCDFSKKAAHGKDEMKCGGLRTESKTGAGIAVSRREKGGSSRLAQTVSNATDRVRTSATPPA
jgi:hypothetical protein